MAGPSDEEFVPSEECSLSPSVSIIMGAFNAERTIRETLDSILSQEFKDWEFIICDDASTDDTLAICQQYANKHPGSFKVIANDRNMKLAGALNRCLAVSRGKYIARMDADDISRPDRLRKLVSVLESQQDIDLVGSSMQRFDGNGLGDVVKPPEHPDRYSLRKGAPFLHPTILARREVYERTGGYNEDPRVQRCEDRELWYEFFSLGFVGMNLAEPLHLFREDIHAIRRRTVKSRWDAFRTEIIGYRKLGYPIHWYVFPALRLFKVLVPARAQMWYRRWQARRSEPSSS